MSKTLRLRINKTVGVYQPGQEVDVEIDKVGIPLEKFWRDRLKDSKFDDCVSIVKKVKQKESKPELEQAPDKSEKDDIK